IRHHWNNITNYAVHEQQHISFNAGRAAQIRQCRNSTKLAVQEQQHRSGSAGTATQIT
ncbi:Hypothetical predicted protein, partial [Pelobates cultripes]